MNVSLETQPTLSETESAKPAKPAKKVYPKPQVEVSTPLTRFGQTNPYYVISDLLKPSSTIYSVGIGSDFSFDLEISDTIGCDSFAFDPTPQSLGVFERTVRQLGSRVKFFNVGFSDRDGTENFTIKKQNSNYMSAAMRSEPGEDEQQITLQIRSVPSVMKQMRHTHIDVFRMDAEGAEFRTIPFMFKHNIYPTQLIFEIHYTLFNNYHKHLEGAYFTEPEHLFDMVRAAGYKIFHVSERGTEVSWLRDFLT